LKVFVIVWPDFAFMFGTVTQWLIRLCRHAVWSRSKVETNPTSSHRQMSRTDVSTRQP